MSNEDEQTIKKLKKWITEHPEEADTPTINITTGKEFTIRGILNRLVEERDTKVAIVDKNLLEVKGQIKKWLEEV